MLMHMQRVFISLGASLQQPANRQLAVAPIRRSGTRYTAAASMLDTALTFLQQSSDVELLACSGYYNTRAWGQERAGSYLNAAACLQTRCLPSVLLGALHRIEFTLGRRRGRLRWGPRPIDLDILLYGNHRINTSHLQIPHRWMWQREFVLWPLADLGDDLHPSRQRAVRQALYHRASRPLARPRRISGPPHVTGGDTLSDNTLDLVKPAAHVRLMRMFS